MDPEFTTYSENSPNFRSKLVEFIQTIVVFAAIATAIYLFIAQPHKVSGSSMFSTLHSGDYIITNKIGYRLAQPQRGEIIVFKNPREESQDFIKRIIGVPGDKVRVENGNLFVNGVRIDEPYLRSSIVTNPGSFLKEGVDEEVPEGRYIVIGDNRPASSDSREWGFITKEEIIGKAFFRYWPLNSIGIIQSAHYQDLN